jgi:hypothetical protein
MALKIVSPHAETSYVANLMFIAFRIPVPRDLRRIRFIQHWIKDRLFRQTRRKPFELALPDQFQLFLAHRPK